MFAKEVIGEIKNSITHAILKFSINCTTRKIPPRPSARLERGSRMFNCENCKKETRDQIDGMCPHCADDLLSPERKLQVRAMFDALTIRTLESRCAAMSAALSALGCKINHADGKWWQPCEIVTCTCTEPCHHHRGHECDGTGWLPILKGDKITP